MLSEKKIYLLWPHGQHFEVLNYCGRNHTIHFKNHNHINNSWDISVSLRVESEDDTYIHVSCAHGGINFQGKIEKYRIEDTGRYFL